MATMDYNERPSRQCSPWRASGEDLSNLCMESSQRSSKLVNARQPSLEYLYVEQKSKQIYPGEEDFALLDDDDLSVEEVFRLAEQADQLNCLERIKVLEEQERLAYELVREREARERKRPLQSVKDSYRDSGLGTQRWQDDMYSRCRSRFPPGAYHAVKQPQVVMHAIETSNEIERKLMIDSRHSAQNLSSDFEYLDDVEITKNMSRYSSYISEDSIIEPNFEPSIPTRRNAPTTVSEVEVEPGVYLPLRGSEETMLAVNMGYALVTSCLCCSVKLKCVPDCDLVICPDCRVVSPVSNEIQFPSQHHLGGVGLGLKVS
jgi:hypothetical protein